MQHSPAIAVALALTWLCSNSAAADESKSWPARPVPEIRLIFNDDGDGNFPTSDPEFNRRFLRSSVDSLIGSGVDVHARCAGAGSDVMYFPTEVASMIGWRQVAREGSVIKHSRISLAAGVEPLRIVGDRCKELGIMFVPSFRMNDAHFARTPDDHQLTGQFWLENRDLAMPNNRLDFSHEKVRKFRLDQITEILDRYADVASGIELDLNRHSMFFPSGQERRKAHLLTRMIEQVRHKLHELERRHGRPFYLFVRVSPTIPQCRDAGMDVDEWMRRRLVDVVIPSQLYNTGFDMPVGDLVALASETGCRVLPTVYIRTQYTWPFVESPTETSYTSDPSTVPTTELIRGLAANHAFLGVHGFEMYNYHLPLGPVARSHARVLAHPHADSLTSRTFAITPAHGSDGRHDPRNARVTPGDSRWLALKQIPAPLENGVDHRFAILVGSDMNSGSGVAPDYVGLRLGLTGVSDAHHLRVWINGKSVYSGPAGAVLTRITGGSNIDVALPYYPLPDAFAQIRLEDLSVLRQGENEVMVRVDADGGSLVEVQLGAIYHSKSRRSI